MVYSLSFNLADLNWPKKQSTSIRYLWFVHKTLLLLNSRAFHKKLCTPVLEFSMEAVLPHFLKEEESQFYFKVVVGHVRVTKCLLNRVMRSITPYKHLTKNVQFLTSNLNVCQNINIF